MVTASRASEISMTSLIVRVTSCVAVLLLAWLNNSSAAPAIMSEADAWNFLRRYGYIPEHHRMSSMMDVRESFSNYLMNMQSNAGIEPTGELDSETIRMMNTPRCGVADVVDSPEGRYFNRYKLNGGKWGKTNLTYGFKIYSKKLPTDLQSSIMKSAFNDWAAVTPLTFKETDWKSSDIFLQFVAGDHNDGTVFDGPGNVQAHALSPRWGGDVCFDEDEAWSSSNSGIEYLTEIARHELGHALGLSHSNDAKAVMYAYVKVTNPKNKLAADDIAGIQAIYGAKYPVPSTTSTTSRPVEVSPICDDTSVDAMEYFLGVTYAFKGNQFYELTSEGSGRTVVGPRSIQSKWPEISGKIDSTFTLYFNRMYQVDPKLYIFQGNKYWVYDKRNTLESGYPKFISVGFPGIPNDLDGAVYIGQEVYFFKGGQCYRYSLILGLERGYPKPVTEQWGEGFPDGVSSGFKWKDSKYYFFSGHKYYRLAEYNFMLEDVNGKSTGPDWFNCPS